MNEYLISVEIWFAGPTESTDDDFEGFIDEVIRQIESLDRDVSVAARLSDRMADFGAAGEGETLDDAMNSYLTDLRTALHAAGAATSGWPFVVRDQTARELQDA